MSRNDREVLHTKEASTGQGHLFSRSQKLQARYDHRDEDDDNSNYRPEKDMYGGSMVPQRSARMLNKARSIKTFNQNIANINKRKNAGAGGGGGGNRNSEESAPPSPPKQQEQQPPPPPPQHYQPQVLAPQFANPQQAAMFEEFQERELAKLREINAIQKQREEEERLLREEESNARLRELRLVRDKRLAMEQEEERIREAKRKEDEARMRNEREKAEQEAQRLEEERIAREEEARIQEILMKQKKAAKKKKLQDEIDTLLDEEDLIEALQELKRQILSNTLNEVDLAAAIERMQKLETYLQYRQQGLAPPPVRPTQNESSPSVNKSTVQMHTNPMSNRMKTPSIQDIAAMSDAELTRTTDNTRNALLDFDTKSEAELCELYDLLTSLESEMAKRYETTGDPKEAIAKEKRELQYQMQEERNGAAVQKHLADRRPIEDTASSDWEKANQLKQEKLNQMRAKEAQLKEAQRLQKEKELKRAQEMRQRLIDEERRVDEEDRQRELQQQRLIDEERRQRLIEEERRMDEQQRQDMQRMQEQEEMVKKLQQKLDAEEILRAKKEEYQRVKELQLKQQRDLAERQRLLEKKQRLAEEKRRAMEERIASDRQREILEQKKGAALLLKEKEDLISQLQSKIDEEEKLRAKTENLKRTNSLKRQDSLKKQNSFSKPPPPPPTTKRRENQQLQRQESENNVVYQLQKKMSEDERNKIKKQLRKQVSFNSSVEVGVFQRQQSNSRIPNFLSDSDSDSGDEEEVNHYSFRDGILDVENRNDNLSTEMYRQKRSSLRPDGSRKNEVSKAEKERAAELSELYRQKRISLRSDGSRKNEVSNAEKERAAELADLYRQKRNGLRPVNPGEYSLRNGFDEDDNTNDRESLEYKSAKFNYSNIGDDDNYDSNPYSNNNSAPNRMKEKKSSFRAYDNPMAPKTKNTPPPPPTRKDNFSGNASGGANRNGGMKKEPSVLARWPPAQKGA